MIPTQRNPRIPHVSRIVLLIASGIAFPLSLRAQSVSPNLAPMLTDNPDSQPITTLAPDLLLPTRTFIFDATGASLTSNGVTPYVYVSSMGIATTQTDTQVRDSSQSGHISPYGSAAAAARLGIGSSTGEGESSAASSLMSSGRSGGMSSGGGQMSGSGFGGSSIASAGSSWGTSSSSFGSNSSDPSWGTGKLRVQRIGRSQTDSSDSGTSQNGEGSSTGGGSGATGDPASLSSTGSSYGSSNHRLNSSSLGRSGSNSRSGRPGSGSLAGSSSGSMNGSTSGSTPGSMTGSSDATSNGRQSQDSPSSMQGSSSSDMFGSHSAMNSHSGASGTGTTTKSATGETLSFLPKFAPDPVFGSSPFSSPSGEGELTFLNPSILRVTAPRSSSSSSFGQTDNEPDQYGLLKRLNTHGGLAGSDTHYGLQSHLKDNSSLKSKNKKSTHLQTSLQDSANP